VSLLQIDFVPLARSLTHGRTIILSVSEKQTHAHSISAVPEFPGCPILGFAPAARGLQA